MNTANMNTAKVYEAFRVTNDIREAIQLTAKQLQIHPEKVCILLGFDLKWAESTMVFK